MPSSSTPTDRTSTRRRILVGAGSTASVSLTGCVSRLPGIEPGSVDTETTTERNKLSWTYPPTDDGSNGIDYASVRVDGPFHRKHPSAVRFRFNSTVGGIASGESYEGYEANWFRFRVGLPADYPSSNTARFRVQPPPWPEIRVRYDRRGGRRDLVVDVPTVNSGGTIEIPFVVDPASNAPLKRLRCSFAAQVSQSNVLGKTVRVTSQGTLELERT